MGIEVRLPQTVGREVSSDASSDPLGDLARAGGFHVRPVTLADGWWRRRGGEPLLGRMSDDGACPRGARAGQVARGPGSGRLTSCTMPTGAGGPSTSSSPDESLRRPGCFTGRSPTSAQEVRPDPLQPEPAGPATRAGDGVRHGPLRRAPRLVDSRSPPASSSTRSCRRPICPALPSSACSSWS